MPTLCRRRSTAIFPTSIWRRGDTKMPGGEGERAVDLEPHAPLAHWQLGRALLFSKQEGRAVTVLERAAQLSGRASMWVAELCYAQACAGDRRAAAMHLSELTARATTEGISGTTWRSHASVLARTTPRWTTWTTPMRSA